MFFYDSDCDKRVCQDSVKGFSDLTIPISIIK